MSGEEGRYDDLMKRVERDFTYHPPKTEVDRIAHSSIGDLYRDVAMQMVDTLPEGRELSMVLTKLQEARMWANGALAVDRAPRD